MAVLKILILGGTTFLGPHLIQQLQQHGHEVTIFTRGNQSSKFSNVEELQGDREATLRHWKIEIGMQLLTLQDIFQDW